MTVAEDAKALAELGLWVFPVNVRPDPDRPWKTTKKPATPGGVNDAINDPYAALDWFEKHPRARIGIDVGRSGLVAADFDTIFTDTGERVGHGLDNFEKEWLDLPSTFKFDSVSDNGGFQMLYAAPKDVPLGPKSNYRGIVGVDRRGGVSYSVWNGPIPESREVFTPAPEWLLDPRTTRSVSETFEGTVKDWYDTLEPGAPNALVRKAMERVNQKFSDLGNDFSHGDVTEFQYEAVRLGSEGNAGVPELLELIEEKFLSRTGAHSRPEDEWAAEFNEALESGIRKAGEAIELRKTLPAYNLATIPDTVPDSLVSGEGGTPRDVTSLIRTLARTDMDGLQALSTVWNAPKTRDVARDWGLEFVHKRITEEKSRVETPSQVIPVSDTPEVAKSKQETVTLLTDKERERADEQVTFLDRYRENVLESMGFVKDEYTNPLSWTILSMAIGRSVVIPINSGLGTNLWFTVLGYSGTGKAQPLHSKVLTPAGFKEMGDMQVGDEVVVPSGGTALVSGVFPQGVRPVYNVTFRDGRVVEADEDHLWTVEYGAGNKRTRTTAELKNDLTTGTEGRAKWYVRNVEAADLGTWTSSIDPYSLGVLTGDGGLSGHSVLVTTADEEILNHLRGEVPEGLRVVRADDKYTYRISGSVPNHPNAWLNEIRRLGLNTLSVDKALPESIKNVSAADRLALLQGIMDTDGTPAKNGNSGDFLSGSATLADDVAWLVRSLGGRATVSEKRVQLDSWDTPRTYYRAYVSLPSHLELFRLERHTSKKNHQGKYNADKLAITSIEFKGYEPTQCIMVDHPDHEYVTDHFTRTHNTSQFEFAQEILDGLLRGHETYWGTGIGSPEGIIESLVQRDGLPSALFEDEGAAWYKDLATKDWMRSLSNQMAKWYNGRATAPQKVRLKELRGKVSDISFNYFTISTPDETLRVIDSEMFASGFMARVAWVYGPEPVEDDERFTTSRTDLNDMGKAIQVSQLTYEMSLFRRSFPGDQRVQVYASEPVKKRLDKAWRDMQRKGKKHPKFAEIIEPSVQRLRETLWKCGAILASYRGSDEIDMDDALVALKNVEVWFSTLFQVSEEVSGAYLRDARQMSDHIRKQGGRIGRRALVKAFGHLITRSQAELADRINYLVDSGQLRAVSDNGQSYYELVE